MRHRMRGRHLSRTASHRKALRQNLANSLLSYGRIITTLEKAKETKSFAEKIITTAKKGLLKKETDKPGYVHYYRQVLSSLRNAEVVKKLFGEGQWRETGGIAQRYMNRNGGDRKLRMLGRRLNDNASRVIFELVEGAVEALQAGEIKPEVTTS